VVIGFLEKMDLMIFVLHKSSSSCGEGLRLSNRFVAFVGTLRVLRSLRSHGKKKFMRAEVCLGRKISESGKKSG